jgi:hypothetical protein
MALLSAVIAVKFLFAYVSCVAIFPAILAVTFGSICSGPLDLVHNMLFGSTFRSVGAGLWVSKAGLQRMPYLSIESAGPAPFVNFPPSVPSHFCWAAFRVFIFFNSLVLMMLCASFDLVVLDDVGLVVELVLDTMFAMLSESAPLSSSLSEKISTAIYKHLLGELA